MPLSIIANPRSVRASLTRVFLLFFGLVLLLGLFSVAMLNYINDVSAEIRDRWLQSTRLLGDLNNFTSDFRAAEGSILLASNAAEIAAGEKAIGELDRLINHARQDYQLLHHDDPGRLIYLQFEAQWESYRRIVDQATALIEAGRRDEAVSLYRTISRAAYDAASDTLGELTDRSVAKGGEARDRAARAYQQACLMILAAIGVAGLLVAGAVRFIQRSLSEPLLDLASQMRRLASNDLEIEIKGTQRADEVGQMARAVVVFQRNARELAVSQHALAAQASMLEEKLEQEQRLTLMQRNFVSMASHEFRTPLTIIDGHAQRLLSVKDRLQPDDLAERARKIRGAVKRVTNVMGNLLDSSRLLDSVGGLALRYIEFDLAVLLHEVCGLHREIAPRAQILEELPATPLPMLGDRDLLFQAFANLLSNAIKYSPDGGLIAVSARAEPGEVRIAVRDHGIGLVQHEVERLFDRYYRGSNAVGTVGTGIGLYFVKMVVELHKGRIRAESNEGVGSRFTMRLPIAASPADATAPALSMTSPTSPNPGATA